MIDLAVGSESKVLHRSPSHRDMEVRVFQVYGSGPLPWTESRNDRRCRLHFELLWFQELIEVGEVDNGPHAPVPLRNQKQATVKPRRGGV